MSDEQDYKRRIGEIFAPTLLRQVEHFKREGKRFVHYCPAEAALSIIRSKEVWLRNSLCMNDWGEVRYGIKQVVDYFQRGSSATVNSSRFWSFLDEVHLGLADDVQRNFDQLIPSLEQETYLTCLSEHEKDEDENGRLSMWRGYGPTTGVALVFNPEPMFNETDVLHAYSFPVLYLRADEIIDSFNQMVEHILGYKSEIATYSKETLSLIIPNLLKAYAICLKHPGFHEEKEWRVVYSPTQRASPLVKQDLQVVRGIPQKIFKLPLQDNPTSGLTGMDIDSILDRVIIGPNAQPLIVYKAFVDALNAAGVDRAEDKVVCSQIPLRT